MLGRYRDSHGRPQLVRTCAPDHTEKVVHLKNEKEKKGAQGHEARDVFFPVISPCLAHSVFVWTREERIQSHVTNFCNSTRTEQILKIFLRCLIREAISFSTEFIEWLL